MTKSAATHKVALIHHQSFNRVDMSKNTLVFQEAETSNGENSGLQFYFSHHQFEHQQSESDGEEVSV